MREVSYQVLSDEDLMGRFCLGDISAFEELYRRHAAKIYGFLKLRLKDSVLVEDVFQETFLKVCKNRAKFNSELPFLPWLFTICRNAMFDSLRRKKTAEEMTVFAEIDALIGAPATVEASQGYSSYLNSLSERERTILELHFVQDLPFKAVAGQVGMSSSAVRKISSRAIAKLRSIWKG